MCHFALNFTVYGSAAGPDVGIRKNFFQQELFQYSGIVSRVTSRGAHSVIYRLCVYMFFCSFCKTHWMRYLTSSWRTRIPIFMTTWSLMPS